MQSNTNYIVFGHLSSGSNNPEKTDSTVQLYFSEFKHGRDYIMGAAPAEIKGGAVVF